MLTNYEISFYLNKLDNFNFDLWTGQKPNTACGIHWYECWHEQGRMLDGAEYDHVWYMFFFSRTNRKKLIWEVVWCCVLHVKVISLKSTHWIFRMFQHVRSRLLSGKSFMKVSKASLMVVNFSNSLVRNSSMAPRELTPKPGKPWSKSIWNLPAATVAWATGRFSLLTRHQLTGHCWLARGHGRPSANITVGFQHGSSTWL